MSSAEIPQPHDGLIRYTFGSPENAASLLQAYLPEALTGALDWQSLELQSGSYVDPELRRSESDLLYRVPVRADHQGSGAEEMFFHILLEHQSTPDEALRFRLLRYEVEILTRLSQERGRLEKAPVILPLVIAQVAGGWRISQQYADFVAWPEGLRSSLEEYVPRFKHLLIDLGRESEESLRGNPEVRLALGLLKAAAEKRILEWIDWGTTLMALIDSQQSLQVFFRYMANAEGGLNLKEAIQKVRSKRLPQAERAIMTIADEIRAEVRAEFLTIADEIRAEVRAEFLTLADGIRAEGRVEGREEGREEGRVEGERRAMEGQVRTLRQVLGMPAVTEEWFAERSLAEIRAQIDALNAEIGKRLSQ